MAFVPDSALDEFTGTTPVKLVASPGSGKRLVKTITVYNKDTEAREVELRLVSTGFTATLLNQVLQPKESFIFGGDGESLVLNSDKSIEGVLDAAPLSDQPHWTAHWADQT